MDQDKCLGGIHPGTMITREVQLVAQNCATEPRTNPAEGLLPLMVTSAAGLVLFTYLQMTDPTMLLPPPPSAEYLPQLALPRMRPV
jgi:hypothetical protein